VNSRVAEQIGDDTLHLHGVEDEQRQFGLDLRLQGDALDRAGAARDDQRVVDDAPGWRGAATTRRPASMRSASMRFCERDHLARARPDPTRQVRLLAVERATLPSRSSSAATR
jgi:hypothetical protein